MRRNLFAVASLILGAVVAGDAGAQRRVVPFLGAGVASATGEFADYAEMGYTLFGGLDWLIASKPGLSVGLGASWTNIPHKGDENEATNIPAVSVELGYLFGATSPSKLKPYVRGGAGFLQHRYDPGDTGFESESDTQAQIGLGVGLQYLMTSTSLFGGAHLVNGLDETTFMVFYGGIAFAGSGASAIRRLIR
jgi:hypothetical protein